MIILDGMRLLSIDPGVDVGLCKFTVGDPIKNMGLNAWQNRYSLAQFYNFLRYNNPQIIICESFDHRAKDNVNYTPVEFIGVVKLYAEQRKETLDDIDLVFQTPSTGKGIKIDRLKKLGLFVPGNDHVDEMMAVRHMLHFLTKHNKFDFGLLK